MANNAQNPGSGLDMDGLRDRIRQALAARGMTIGNLSKATDIPQSTISDFLGGRSVPAFDRVYAICAALDITVDGLGGDPPDASADGAAPYGTEYIPDMKAMHQREVDQLSASGAQALEALRQAHADQLQAMDRHMADLRRSLRLWQIISLALIGLLVLWFVWDVTNGSRGLIRYDQAAYLYPYGGRLPVYRG